MKTNRILGILSFALLTYGSNAQTYYYAGVGAGSVAGTTSSNSTGIGYNALFNNNTTSNTAVGTNSLYTTGTYGAEFGSYNTAIGTASLYSNTVGRYNCAVGDQSLLSNTTGYGNVSIGRRTMELNTVSGYNVGIGSYALGRLTGADSDGNVAIGNSAGALVTSGKRNVFIGNYAGPMTVAPMSDRLYIGNYSNPANSSYLPLIYGEFDTKKVRFYVNNSVASKVEVTSSVSGVNGTSGLKFTNLLNTNNAIANPSSPAKVLTVNDQGDVILVLDNNGAGPGSDTSIYSHDGAIAATNMVTANTRTVTMGNNNLYFKTNGTFTDGTVGTGRVYIGSSMLFPTLASPDSHYRLLVEGGLLTERVKIALRSTANWQDVVFEEDYKLMPLDQVESYVKDNKHLPGIESAQELVDKGLDVGEMQAKQMGKIEELTLYIIGQDKQMDEQKAALEKQNNEIQELKAQMKALLEKR
jgi:hypothetical protein